MVVLLTDFIVAGMRRPFDAHVPQVVQTRRNRTIAAVHEQVIIHLQAHHTGAFNRCACPL
ncbi:hypothetical protein D3C73_1527760 [compost metagenome]